MNRANSGSQSLPTVGVIMTAYNGAPYIEVALQSLIEQTFTRWECVVVDDGSTDATAELVEKMSIDESRIRLIRQQRHGVSQARNTGLAALSATVSYIAFLDCDDSYLVGALQSLVPALAARPDAVGVYGLAELTDADGTPVRPGEHSKRQLSRRRIGSLRPSALDRHADSTFNDVSLGGAIWPSAVGLHRSDIIEQLNGFDESFTRQGDWELYLRMSRHGPFCVLPEQVAWYRRHDANLTGDIIETFYQQERARYKAWKSSENTTAQRKVLARGARWMQLSAGKALARQFARDLSDRQPRKIGWDALGLALVAASLLKPGPPKPSRWRVRTIQRNQSNPYGSR